MKIYCFEQKQKMASIHFIGQIIGGSEFSQSNIYCVWSLQSGPHWKNISGAISGQSQISSSGFRNHLAVWAHPIDIHMSTTSVVGWPKLVCQIWHIDAWGRNDFGILLIFNFKSHCISVGYGMVHLPSTCGSFDLKIQTWKPVGSSQERISEAILGGAMQLKDDSLVWNGQDRTQLRTVGSGVVQIHVNVLMKNFAKHGVQV